jgi:hypothetical protein
MFVRIRPDDHVNGGDDDVNGGDDDVNGGDDHNHDR